ncbi:uncharacterized protein LOC125222539 isoform X2 [Salvia hispanica]|uniref:uncharacterized protein LOC125222539 isoform X2 n=1 Tax=Salvia hispanica TaxID=49212 RepID=UPI0020091064|nr:uncharacterized protein LOC125222539 isoform X2 [Salvia hispanica]
MEGGERRVKLYCPSLPKAIEIAAVDDQKLDLGSIARAFGLDPNTLKLNGYFIATTPDHIASSLTWNSLIRFFTARGLPSGAAPLLVHGSHQVEDAADVTRDTGCFRESKRHHCSTSSNPGDLNKSSGLSLKRKWGLENGSRLKRARSDEGQFSCSFISRNLKRMQIDEIVAATPFKKLR